jgi:hypothetical protein
MTSRHEGQSRIYGTNGHGKRMRGDNLALDLAEELSNFHLKKLVSYETLRRTGLPGLL